jgi:uncharacterized protein (DUF58 family)
MLLSFMSISGIFGKSNLSKISFTVDLPQEIYAGTPVPLKITLTNNRRFLPAFLIRLTTDTFEAFFPFTNIRSALSLYTSISFEKRGAHTINNIRINSVFPFNFFTRFKKINHTYDCVVFPVLKPCDLSSVCEQEKKKKGEKVSDRRGYESDVVSIREYVRGDPLKYIHWKATAKTGKLKTKELSSLDHRPVIIDFEKVSIANIEERISSIAYAIVQFCKKNIPVGLKINGKLYLPDVSSAHKINLLRELALYGTERKTLLVKGIAGR